MVHPRRACRLLAPALVFATVGLASAEPLVTNGGFETPVTLSATPVPDSGFGLWALGPDHRAPSGWTMNSAFPGDLALISGDAHGGQAFVDRKSVV